MQVALRKRIFFMLLVIGLGNIILIYFGHAGYLKKPESAQVRTNLWGKHNNGDVESHTNDRISALEEWIQHVSKDEDTLKSISVKTILVYDSFERWEFKHPKGRLSLSEPKLCHQKCKFTEDKTQKDFVDGVVMIRDWYYNKEITVLPDVFKIFSFMESPLASSGNLSSPNTIVNSYFRGSDIVSPYGKWLPYPERSNLHQVPINYAASKTKLAAVFISNCDAMNDRMKYVKRIYRNASVDVYGLCGKLRCHKNSTESCFSLLKNYKFYLAFENANCRDYITEKFFQNALQNDIVPVVMGAHPNDYKAIAPPNSFIHVDDFQSPESLVEYLKILDKNDTLYNEYFRWKGTGEFYDSRKVSTFCRMCSMLHYAQITGSPPLRQKTTWETFNTCLPPYTWYWTRNNELLNDAQKIP